MKRKEYKLLVENWRTVLHKSEEDYILEESYLKKGIGALALLGTLLGQSANVQVADAMPSEEIANKLDDAFNKKHPGAFSIMVTTEGDVIGIHNKSGKEQLMLTDEQCENISEEELEDALEKLDTEGYSSYKKEILKAAERQVQQAKKEIKKEKRSVIDRIKSMSEADKDALLKDFRGEDNFNLQLMQYEIVASRLWKESPEFKKYGSKSNILVWWIMKYHRSMRKHLPK